MGVKIRFEDGAWWIRIDQKGQRRSKNIGDRERRWASPNGSAKLANDRRCVLVAECKRRGSCSVELVFVRAPMTRRNSAVDPPIVSQLYHDLSSGHVQEWPSMVGEHTERPFHIGHELRTGDKGDGIGSSEKAIAGAVEQVMRGAGGIMEAFGREPALALRPYEPAPILPVVFTTARLFVSDIDLATSNVATGHLVDVPVREVTWLWYQATLSRALRPGLQVVCERPDSSMGATLVRRHMRAVAIVSPDGLRNFLDFSGELVFDRI
jgi:hypothetical protein